MIPSFLRPCDDRIGASSAGVVDVNGDAHAVSFETN